LIKQKPPWSEVTPSNVRNCPERDSHSGADKHHDWVWRWRIQAGGLLGKQRYRDGRIFYKIKCPVCLGNSGAIPNAAVPKLKAKGMKVVWTQDHTTGGDVVYAPTRTSQPDSDA
jgi:hypothetical protein